jgi:hypothetical protein
VPRSFDRDDARAASDDVGVEQHLLELQKSLIIRLKFLEHGKGLATARSPVPDNAERPAGGMGFPLAGRPRNVAVYG